MRRPSAGIVLEGPATHDQHLGWVSKVLFLGREGPFRNAQKMVDTFFFYLGSDSCTIAWTLGEVF